MTSDETRLHAALCALIDLAIEAGESARATRLALARICYAVVCGDFAAGAIDVVEALRAVPEHRATAVAVLRMTLKLRRGEFTRDYQHGRFLLSPEQWRALAWVCRFCIVYGAAPVIAEIAAGIERTFKQADYLVRRLVEKGAVAKHGKAFVALREP